MQGRGQVPALFCVLEETELRTADPECLPTIGIVTRRDQSALWKGFVLYGQGRDYCASVSLAGGAPLLIPLDLCKAAWRSIYLRLDGLLFPGGVDIDPAHYAQQPHPRLGPVEEALDEAELVLASWALEDQLPVLAICRGIQLINVAAGGSLYQDIPTQCPDALLHACHPPKYPRDHHAHTVSVEARSKLAGALGTSECWVNSRHHQAVDGLAPSFTISARAADGIVEGIEHAEAPFIVGVQWHPENLAPTDPLMLGLFAAFVRASRH